MTVIQARIQTVEDIYGLVRTAVTTRRSLEAVYGGRRLLLCPHRLGRNSAGQLRVLCYQFGGESRTGLERVGSPANWRCIALEGLRAVTLLDDGLWCTAQTILARNRV
jgi:hypothetical protein